LTFSELITFFVGPDARPLNTTDTSESLVNSSETLHDHSTSTARSRNLQNFLMQRMSDILTQFVARTASEPEEANEEVQNNAMPVTIQPEVTSSNEVEHSSNPMFRSSASTEITAMHVHNDENRSQVSTYFSILSVKTYSNFVLFHF
jgi:hypothetical protein